MMSLRLPKTKLSADGQKATRILSVSAGVFAMVVLLLSILSQNILSRMILIIVFVFLVVVFVGALYANRHPREFCNKLRQYANKEDCAQLCSYSPYDQVKNFRE